MDDVCHGHSGHDERIKGNTARLDNHDEALEKLTEIAIGLKTLSQMTTEWQKKVDERVAALESAPAKRWEHVSSYAPTAILGAIATLVMTHFGIK